MRIRHGDYDWSQSSAETQLDVLLSQVLQADLTSMEGECRPVIDNVLNPKTSMGGPIRIATVCVQGGSAKSVADNGKKQELLKAAIDAIIRNGWTNLDAVLLPGGFFYLDTRIEHLSFDERARAISQTSFHQCCMRECNAIASLSAGAFIVAGVDSQNDHLCIAWSVRGIEGIGRKIFPVPRGESSWYVCDKGDYAAFKRIVDLPSGRPAILCACYDVFGCAETTASPTVRTSSIRNIADGGNIYTDNKHKTKHERSFFKKLRRNCINDFQNLLVSHGVAVGLGAIHNFRKPGTDNYWQRHGIQACSAALDGGFTVGAAHFAEGLPLINKSTLAAADIPRTYLSDKPFNKRKIDEFSPKDGFYAANETALVRLFEF